MRNGQLQELRLRETEAASLPICFRSIRYKDTVSQATLRSYEIYSDPIGSLTVGCQPSDKPISKIVAD